MALELLLWCNMISSILGALGPQVRDPLLPQLQLRWWLQLGSDPWLGSSIWYQAPKNGRKKSHKAKTHLQMAKTGKNTGYQFTSVSVKKVLELKTRKLEWLKPLISKVRESQTFPPNTPNKYPNRQWTNIYGGLGKEPKIANN